jgi:hypothetical protein
LVRKEQFSLPESPDYKTHKTSLEVKTLPPGIYLAEYVVENSVQSNFYFIVSDTKIIYSKKNDSGSNPDILKLVNNENGKAFMNENLEITEFTEGNSAKNILQKRINWEIFSFQNRLTTTITDTTLLKTEIML